MEVEDAQEELDRRREVLQQAQRHHRDADRGGAEEHQWDGGDQAAGRDESSMAEAVRAEVGLAAGDQPRDVRCCHRCQHQRLDGEALDRPDVGLLLCQPVGAEGEGQHQRDPRHPAVVERQHDDRAEGDGHGDPLQAAQVFTEDEDAHEHRHERIDEVAQGRLHDPTVVDAPDIATPVEGDHHGGEGEEQERPSVAHHRDDGGTSSPQRHDDHHRDHRPDHPVGQQLDGPGRLKMGPVEREDPPQRVGQGSEHQPTTVIRHSRSLGWRRRLRWAGLWGEPPVASQFTGFRGGVPCGCSATSWQHCLPCS